MQILHSTTSAETAGPTRKVGRLSHDPAHFRKSKRVPDMIVLTLPAYPSSLKSASSRHSERALRHHRALPSRKNDTTLTQLAAHSLLYSTFSALQVLPSSWPGTTILFCSRQPKYLSRASQQA